ncbi:hypothetical protein [Mycobacterium sp. 1245111.1]|uniref:hypothetical protein n=1 Tax=Mycobacterium sp. 1245111.1 TaxID=1834073 RepID=UPI000B1EAFE4|nr:hypothetical protein [Mycobacterium sp. 1245111.1]
MRRGAASRWLEVALLFLALAMIAWLSVVAAVHGADTWLPTPLRWFGGPESTTTIAIVVTVIVALCVLRFRAHNARASTNVPVVVVAGLAATSAVLGASSVWHCSDATHPAFFQPLLWTISIVKGGGGDFALSKGTCPTTTPDALWVARLAADGAIFTGLAGVVIALFRSQVDRLRVRRARSVTAVIGVDDESRSMIKAIATTNRSKALVVITNGPDDPGAQEARLHGGRVLSIDLSDPESLAALSLWRRLDRLYLLSPDPPTNQLRLDVITRALTKVGHRQRLPLTVRVDDPWQAEAWRAEQLGGTDTRWAADAVGRYEVTARWLLENIISLGSIERVFVCGASELTLALCADMTRRKLESDYYSDPEANALPAVSLVSEEADEYLQDHEFHRRQLGFASAGPIVDACPQQPSMSALMRLIGDRGGPNNAVIFVDDQLHGPSNARSTGTRLAARFPTMPIYIWDAAAQTTSDPLPIVGRLRTYRLALDIPEGQAQDVWERAARLIHQRYVSSLEPDPNPPPVRLPWPELNDFYKDSNRRQVANALWMVEKIAEHTWNTWGDPPTQLGVDEMNKLSPLEKLAHMGFDHDAAMKMAKAEHEDWCRFLRHNKWEYDPVRDDEHRKHNKLIAWPSDDPETQTAAEKDVVNASVASLAATLWSLRQLGFRSRPVWQRFTRVGTVIAEQQNAPWTWTSDSGHTMHANAGDWRLRADGETWSVRDKEFRASYKHVDGDQWRRHGTVSARPARPGEIIETLEGPNTAGDGDWVVRGESGEQWPVPAQEFAERYKAEGDG